MIRIEFDPSDPRPPVEVPAPEPGLALSDWLRTLGLPLNTRCGQRGQCDGCVVELRRGALRDRRTGRPVVAGDEPLTLRGCEHAIPAGGPVTLRLPARSLVARQAQAVSSFKLNVSRAHDPLVTPHPGGSPRTLGAAIDIGTTTVALLLVDLANGRVVGKAAGFNRQIDLGDNVLTRINLCLTDPPSIARLQRAVVADTINPLLDEALAKARAGIGEVACFTVAGNTTMLHLFAGVDPSPMGLVPFTPAFLEHRVLDASALGLRHDPSADRPVPVHLLPSASAYIGADLTGGALATGLSYDDGPCLLVDVGTNGEIILKHGGALLGCATAAGPAFEGSGLASGVRAARGAIERIAVEPGSFEFTHRIIGDGPPTGVCGSGYIDFLASGVRTGLLDRVGRFSDAAVAGLNGRMTALPGCGRAVRLLEGGSDAVIVSEPDIAKLLQAKAAVAAGILTLLERSGLRPADVRRLYLAGGFGLHIDVPNAVACGLLPGFIPSQVQAVGNTALGGAYLALLDRGALAEIERIAKAVRVVELNLDPGFESRFIDQLMLPEPR